MMVFKELPPAVIHSPILQLIRPKLSNSDGFRFFRWRFVYYKFNLFKRFGLLIFQGTMYFSEVF